MATEPAHDADAVETVRQWVNSARFDEELIELETQTLRAMLATHDATAAELERLRAERAELEAMLAEGSQRDRAVALLLLRDGGQVEFTLAERVAAPQDGELISYPNAATGGLVLAFQAANAAPQQPAQPCPSTTVSDAKAGES